MRATESRTMRVVVMSKDGRLTLPAEARREIGIEGEVEFEVEGRYDAGCAHPAPRAHPATRGCVGLHTGSSGAAGACASGLAGGGAEGCDRLGHGGAHSFLARSLDGAYART